MFDPVINSLSKSLQEIEDIKREYPAAYMFATRQFKVMPKVENGYDETNLFLDIS